MDGAGPIKTMKSLRTLPLASKLAAIALSAPLLLGLSACTEVNRFLARAESKPANEAEAGPQVGAQTAPEPIPEPQEKPKPGRLYEWNGDGRKVSRIVVNTDEQKARFYDGDEQVGWTTVASGVTKFPTPTGHFEVMEKVANKRSNLYGKIYGAGGKVVRSDAKAGRDPIPSGARFEGAQMPYFLRLTNDGIGLHAGPIPRPGRPASHGCIRMPSKLAPVLFQHVDLGTKVSIVGSGPDYGDYVQKQRALAARERARQEAAAREQAVAAAAASTASPALANTSDAETGASGGIHASGPAEIAGDAPAYSPAEESARARPPVAGPSGGGSSDTPVAQAEDTRPAPQAEPEAAGSAPAADTAAPVAHTAEPPQPSPPGSPVVGAPAPPLPAPGYPTPVLSPMAPPPYYAPPMRPAAATLAPIVVPAPAAVATPGPAPTPPSSPATSPTPDPTPAAPSVSAEQPEAAAGASGG
jgi:lipoprotein-anchoring transpeptidase ErfK/SrfK